MDGRLRICARNKNLRIFRISNSDSTRDRSDSERSDRNPNNKRWGVRNDFDGSKRRILDKVPRGIMKSRIALIKRSIDQPNNNRPAICQDIQIILPTIEEEMGAFGQKICFFLNVADSGQIPLWLEEQLINRLISCMPKILK